MKQTYYLDYNATTPVAPEVWQQMEPLLREQYGNPSSVHHSGKAASKVVRQARVKVAELLGADEREIIFTSCGSESNNAAIRSALATNPGKKQIVTSRVEHSSVKKLGKYLTEEGYEFYEVGVTAQGFLNIDELRHVVSEKTAIVSLMLANNETGVFFPVNEIGGFLKEKGIMFHVDGVQAVGKHPLNLKESPVDFFSASAHKLYGPKGIGCLYVKKNTPFRPFIAGGSQERGRRAGTENVAGIAGFGAACELALKDLPEEIQRLKSLRRYFEDTLMKGPHGIVVNGDLNRRLPTTSNLRFPGVDGESLLMALDQKGICISSGSACTSGSTEPSHVLKAMGLTDDESKSSVRFSFGRYTTEETIREVLVILQDTLGALKESSKRNRLMEPRPEAAF